MPYFLIILGFLVMAAGGLLIGIADRSSSRKSDQDLILSQQGLIEALKLELEGKNNQLEAQQRLIDVQENIITQLQK